MGLLTGSLLLTGCSSPKVEVVTIKDVEYVYKGVPKELLVKDNIPAPIEPEAYKGLSNERPNEREIYLVGYVGSLLEHIAKLRTNLNSIEKHDMEQRKLYTETTEGSDGGVD